MRCIWGRSHVRSLAALSANNWNPTLKAFHDRLAATGKKPKGAPTGRIEAAEVTAREIDEAVRDALANAFKQASDILQLRYSDLEKGVELLLSEKRSRPRNSRQSVPS
jgi:hypothetical protein